MNQRVKEEISVRIKNRTFDLVWNPDELGSSACNQCALLGGVCKGTRDLSLLALCATIVEEPETFFVESKPEFTPKGINEKEILVTALAEYKKVMEAMGNTARASKIESMLDRI